VIGISRSPSRIGWRNDAITGHVNAMAVINLVGWDNGVGISRDMRLMERVLRDLGCEVVSSPVRGKPNGRHWSKWRRLRVQCRLLWDRQRETSKRIGRYDLNIMFEHVYLHAHMKAKRNLVIPNPEWFDARDRPHLSSMDHVWAKTHYAEKTFARLGTPTTWIGFDSEDRYDASVPRDLSFFHLAGQSVHKGTARLLDLWLRHPEWPTLTVVKSLNPEPDRYRAPNIVYRGEYLPDAELKALQNSHLVHICTSESEGWGHYLVEALGVGAVVITLDAPPMNELVTLDRGVLIAHESTEPKELATLYRFDPRSLEVAVERILSMGHEERLRLGTAARDWFSDNARGFTRRVEAGLNAALGSTVLPARLRESSTQLHRPEPVAKHPN
jgi:glycosyltransferase involved in cell wall biosynthesis